MKIANSVISRTGLDSPLSRLIVDEFSAADRIAGPGADHTQVIHSWEKKTGERLKQSKIRAKL